MVGGGTIYYKHADYLSNFDMRFRAAAERVTVTWIRERVERRKQGVSSPPVPEHLLG